MKLIEGQGQAIEGDGAIVYPLETIGFDGRVLDFARVNLRPGYSHGKTATLLSDRIYLVFYGSGVFIGGGRECGVGVGDVVFVRKGERYDFKADRSSRLGLLVINSPPFCAEAEVLH